MEKIFGNAYLIKVMHFQFKNTSSSLEVRIGDYSIPLVLKYVGSFIQYTWTSSWGECNDKVSLVICDSKMLLKRNEIFTAQNKIWDIVWGLIY